MQAAFDGATMAPKSERAQLVAELRRIGASEPRFTYDWLHRQDRPLLQRLLTEFGDLARARKAAGLPPLDPIRKWTEERLIEEMRGVYRATGALTAKAIIQAGRHDLVGATQAHGGLIRARRLAGLPEPVPVRRGRGEPWDAERVVSEILDRHARDESVAFSKVPSALTAAGARFFGSWQLAIEAAGLNYDEVRMVRAPYSREEVISLLQRLAKEQPRMLWGELYEHSAQGAMIRWFGSIPAAVQASDVVGWPLVGQAQWSRDAVVRAVQVTQRRRARALASPVSGAARLYVGGATKARRAAGVQVLRRPWDRERVISELRESALRRVKPSSNLRAACLRLFGGMAAAREEAGVEARDLVWPRERILAALREHAARGEHVVRGPLAEACYRHFGGIRAARRAAGVADPSRVWWTRERVIEALQREQATGKALGRSAQHAAFKLFGSTRAAREAAGIPRPPARRDVWSAERVINELRRFAREEHEPTQRLSIEARRLFGSMAAARKVAKVSALTRQRWTRERVLEELKARPGPASRLRHHVRQAAERHFGSVPAALEAAGITTRFCRWDKPTVIAELQEAARGDGRIREALALAAARQFGSITEARRAAGVPLLHQRWTRDLVLAEVQRHGARGLPEQLRSACDRFFGSVADARRAAGVDAPQRPWTAERVLDELRTKWADRGFNDAALVKACARFFGSVAGARKAAKLVPLTETMGPGAGDPPATRGRGKRRRARTPAGVRPRAARRPSRLEEATAGSPVSEVGGGAVRNRRSRGWTNR